MSSQGTIQLSDADAAHVEAITRIYAHYVLHATCSFELEAPTPELMRQRLAVVRGQGLPWLVALRAGTVLGYAYASLYRPRPAYGGTVENSVYLAPDCRGEGVGRLLLEELVRRCRAAGKAQMVAVVGDSGNTASRALHARLGFREVGVLQHVGFKFGRWLDTVLMQKALGDPQPEV